MASYYSFTARRYTTAEITAVITSVTQNACHTPVTPTIRLNANAAGTITNTYRQSEIRRDGPPFPRPSSEPPDVTDMEDTTNPIQITLSATLPTCTVCAFVVNIPISQVR